ncbi:hypothetical protein BGZ94_009346 [Podila epigama]|nr:hypothetical protein BGZ94_009346 [Podila epigama]
MPFVDTLDSYSRALYLPLRAYVRRPFQFVTDSIRDHVPLQTWDLRKALEQTLEGLSSSSSVSSGHTVALPGGSSSSSNGSPLSSTFDAFGVLSGSDVGSISSSFTAGSHSKHTQPIQPSMANFFTSRYFLLMFFVSIVMNRINAIVAPRNPHPLKLSVRFALKIPAFFLLAKSAIVTGSLILRQFHPDLFKTSYTESNALWLSFVAMGVSCTLDSFISNLHSNGISEPTTSVLEWAILFHFSPSGFDILLMSFVQMCQLLTLQLMSLTNRNREYRLMVTTFFGMVDLCHFSYAVYHRSSNYPTIQMLTRLPEVVVILMICISLVLHALTYIVTGGNVRRQMFDPTELPGLEEEYGSAIFKVGRACMEATRGMGFKNEIDAVVVPLGTVLDKKNIPPGPSIASTLFRGPLTQEQQQQLRRGNVTISQLALWSLNHHGASSSSSTPPTGFANEMPDAVESPTQRQQISRRRTRILVIQAFCRSTARLFVESSLALYNRIVPARFRRATQSATLRTNRITVQEYIQLRSRIEQAMDNARQRILTQREEAEAQLYAEASALMRDEEEEIYNMFLSQDLDSSDDDDFEYNDRFARAQESDSEDDSDDGDSYKHDNESNESVSTEEPPSEFGMPHRRRRYEEDGVAEDEGEDQVDEEEEDALEQKLSPLRSLQDFFLDTGFMSIFLSSRLQDTPLTRFQFRQHQSMEYSFGSDDDIGAGVGKQSRAERQSRSEGSSGSDMRTLMTVLKRHRRSANESDPGVSQAGASMPPPLIQPAQLSEDSTIQSRLLCVVCQSEPRGVLLRPCRCLALCNDCREVLASRRFKQCPCCRSDVQGFSKVYLP